MKLTRSSLILLAILSLAIFLRIYGISSESFWYDEGLSIRFAEQNASHVIGQLSAKEVHPPFYYLLLHYWIKQFGTSEFSVRFLSAIFGILAVFMIYKVGHLLFDKQTGIISSLILAVSSFHVYFSQEVRMYTLVPLLALFSMYFFLKILKEKTAIDQAGWVVSTVLLIYTPYSGVLIIFTQNLYFITLFLLSKKESRPHLMRWIALQLLVVLLYSPWIGILVKQAGSAINPQATVAGSTIPKLPPPEFAMPLVIRFFTQYAGTKLLAGILLIFSAFSLVTIERRRPIFCFSGNNKIYLLLIWLLSPFILPLMLSKFTRILYFAKYLIANSLALYLLAAKGLSNVRLKHAKWLALALIVTLSLINVNEIYLRVNKEPWQRAVQYIGRNAKPGDLILFNPPYFQKNAFDLYSERTDLTKVGFPPLRLKTTYVDEKNIKELDPILAGHDRVWFIQAHIHDPKGLIEKRLAKSHKLTYQKKYPIVTFYRPPKVYVGIKMRLFEKKR